MIVSPFVYPAPQGTSVTAGGRALVLRAGEGEAFRIAGDRFLRKGSASEGFSVIEYEGAPGVPGPPRHLHREFEEAWYILEGEVEFTAGSAVSIVRPGAYVHVPRGVPHTFRVTSTAPARWIGIFSPGRYVRLLEELGPLLPDRGPPDMAAIERLFARYDTALVP